LAFFLIPFEKARLGSSMIELSIGTWRVSIRRTTPEIIDVARMYDNAAWLWHPIVALLGYTRAYENLFKALAADGWWRGLPDGAKALDAGIGTGALSAALAKTTPRVREIHGVNIAPRMLARARDKLPLLGRPDLTTQLRHGDVACLPYPVSEFDMEMSAHLLEHSSDPSATVGEMARVLRVGGPLLMITTRVNAISALHGLRWRYRAIESRQLLQWMRQAGLSDVRRYPLGRDLFLPASLSEAHIGWKPDR
jgi:demethylmenaquinone methyltransferase/2-methoxy-6-polyprenyl-1,4-benzoquinol methylase